jgi:SOS-response transcriptional repressor LexA
VSPGGRRLPEGRVSWHGQDRSDKRERLLEAVKTLMRRHQRPPTMRELKDETGISSTSVVAFNLRKLQADGRLRLTDNVSTRGLRLVLGPDDECPYCGRRGRCS